MSGVLVAVLTSAVVATLISSVVAVVNGQLQRGHELELKRAEENRQLRDLKRERLWAGLRAIAEVAMGVQEANADLMRIPADRARARKGGDELYTLVEGHRADIVLSSREGRDLLLQVVGAVRQLQLLCDSWDTHLTMAQAQGSDDPEVCEHRRFIDQEHDLIHRSAWAVLDRTQAMIEALEEPAYPRTKRAEAPVWFKQAVDGIASWWPWRDRERLREQKPPSATGAIGARQVSGMALPSASENGNVLVSRSGGLRPDLLYLQAWWSGRGGIPRQGELIAQEGSPPRRTGI